MVDEIVLQRPLCLAQVHPNFYGRREIDPEVNDPSLDQRRPGRNLISDFLDGNAGLGDHDRLRGSRKIYLPFWMDKGSPIGEQICRREFQLLIHR